MEPRSNRADRVVSRSLVKVGVSLGSGRRDGGFHRLQHREPVEMTAREQSNMESMLKWISFSVLLAFLFCLVCWLAVSAVLRLDATNRRLRSRVQDLRGEVQGLRGELEHFQSQIIGVVSKQERKDVPSEESVCEYILEILEEEDSEQEGCKRVNIFLEWGSADEGSLGYRLPIGKCYDGGKRSPQVRGRKRHTLGRQKHHRRERN
ncbi:unnamed protein product [Darwinula stevensoni]|uniref:Uncharacterized protein n=1 Tax=Darwinula stevensoni TaxID=69355 RepID=A0A7R8XCX9_9CRUS|nr:unnamed protein product [Darwinula stevensoni]CAG0888053.1 unnamed protein product [Darwinula stevensoni]